METLKPILAVLVGVLINLAFGFNEALGKPDYRLLLFIKQNAGPTILNLVCGLAFAFATEGESLLNIMFFSSAGQFYWKKLANIFSERVPTKVGY